MAKKKAKRYLYHKYLEWKKDGRQMSLVTQMYSVSLYVCIYEMGRMVEQFGADPKRFSREQRKTIDDMKSDPKVTDIVLGTEVAAFENEQGYWEIEDVQEKADDNEKTTD